MTLQIKTLQPGSADWLQQAVFISWFTDARLADDQPLPDNGNDRRGHWADLYVDGDDSLGSLLWTLRREKLTPDIINRARDIAVAALRWLLDTTYVTAYRVEAARLDYQTIGLVAFLQLPDGSEFEIRETFNAV